MLFNFKIQTLQEEPCGNVVRLTHSTDFILQTRRCYDTSRDELIITYPVAHRETDLKIITVYLWSRKTHAHIDK